MIQFNKVNFLDDHTIYIDAQIPDYDYFTGCYISEILMDTQDTVCASGPSTKAVTLKTFSNNPTRIAGADGIIDVSEYTNCNNPKMLFIYIHVEGYPATISQAPCGWDKEYEPYAVANMYGVYQQALKYVKCTKGCGCVGEDCAVDANFANFALQYFRLSTALEIMDWETAFDAYKVLMRCSGKKRKAPTYKPCGCNGSNS